jgi:ribosome-associated protein
MQYIGKLMRTVDAQPIRAAIDAWRTQSTGHTAVHKRIEAWRERLLAEPDAIDELTARYPGVDVLRLNGLISDALREREAHRPPRSYRELFQALRALIEKK